MGIIGEIAGSFMISESELRAYLNTAPHRYKVYRIMKRNEKGLRVIAQPARALKRLQKHVIKNYLIDQLPLHTNATAYREGASIRNNAQLHVENEYLLKMDFSNFFPSIVSDDLLDHSKKYLESYTEEHIFLLEKLFFMKGRGSSRYSMSIGAPSSPFLSNSIMYDFDVAVSDICNHHKVVYSRYADDMTFSCSTKGLLFEFPDIVESCLNGVGYPSLKINDEKTVFSSKKHNRHVTGLVLSNEGKVSLGRNRKRYIRSLVFKYMSNELDEEQIHMLEGLLAFSMDVEPEFIGSMVKKYGSDVFSKLHKNVLKND